MSEREDEILPGPVTPGRQQEAIHLTRQRGPNSQNNRLMEIGSRLTPEGYKHVGSFGIHVYKSALGASVASITQIPHVDATMTEANFAVQQASMEIAKSYGWKPPATRRDVMNKDIHSKGIILPADFGKTPVPEDSPATSTPSSEAPASERTPHHGKEES